MSFVSEALSLTIVYEDAGHGCIVASIPEVPGAHSQGHTRARARENVIDALHGIPALGFGEHSRVVVSAAATGVGGRSPSLRSDQRTVGTAYSASA